MRCISPLLIRTNGRRDTVPCGKCNYCLQSRRADWSFRLLQEWKVCSSAKFLTLTYDEEHVPKNSVGLQELSKNDVQLFHKRLRKEQAKYNHQPLRYYSVGEYGTKTLRPHYHSIMFNLDRRVIDNLMAIWNRGHCHAGEVTPASIHYVTKYVINKDAVLNDRAPPFAIMSRKPGIGSNYLASHSSWHRADNRNYVRVNGVLGRLPRYFKDKMFTDFERKLMSLDSIQGNDSRYWAEIERLSFLHSDPQAYYDERAMVNHDLVKSKVNSLNKF